jgi:phage tail sheath protein FI
MPSYLSPGVYVEEVASGSAPIVGVGTSIAAFIGTIKANISPSINTNTPSIKPVGSSTSPVELGEGKGGNQKNYPLLTGDYPIITDSGTYGFFVNGSPVDLDGTSPIVNNDTDKSATVKFKDAVASGAKITGYYQVRVTASETGSKSPTTIQLPTYKLPKIEAEKVGIGNGKSTTFELRTYPVSTSDFRVNIAGKEQSSGVSLANDDSQKKSQLIFTTAPAEGEITVDYYPLSVAEGEIKLCTNFSEFKKLFGDFLPANGDIQGQNTLAHAVYGFFRNGGTRCYVTWISGESKVSSVLEDFEAIDEITIVVAPGNLDLRDDIKDHCEKMGDRIAVLDTKEEESLDVKTLKPFNSQYAALYFPWIQVFDPASNTNIFIPPSGHIAGVYARVDGQRGVHKAPGNETILGALDLRYNLSKAKQDGLNPDGINCIRKLNGNIRIWGARTVGGDANGEFKYVNIRRHFSYLRDSIDKGTQWVVFEPNTPELWAKIRRNIGAFLVIEWRKGALFGTTPEEAFYVKCDAENNPPEVRDLGQVVTEIGLAVVKPAEFVIFRLSQWAGSGK